MSSGQQQLRKVHFVGSIPLSNADEVFRTLCAALPGRLKRIPDGETGERCFFVWWQRAVFEGTGVDHILKGHPQDPPLRFTEAEVIRTMKYFPQLETGYDSAAILSYRAFSRLRALRVIPPHVRFQVSLPSPANFISTFIEPAFQARVEPYYETALIRAIENIQAQIPHQDLAIQFDMSVDLIILHGAWPQAYIPTEPTLMPHVVEKVARLVDRVAEDVEIGFHLCYGDFEKKRLMEPPDMDMMTNFAQALITRVRRKVAWVQMPVPTDREDQAYFEPLRRLTPTLTANATELYLGLVYHQDLQSTERKMQIARKVLGEQIQFGIATECGLGRQDKKYLDDILHVTLAASRGDVC